MATYIVTDDDIKNICNPNGLTATWYDTDDGGFSGVTVSERSAQFLSGNEIVDFETPILEAKARKKAMLAGKDYQGYQASFTKDDGNGLIQVGAAFDMGITNTVMHFENGTKMPITATEFAGFAAWFVAERNNFFVVVS